MKGHVVNKNSDESPEAGGQWSANLALLMTKQKLAFRHGKCTVEVSRFIGHLERWSHENERQPAKQRRDEEKSPRLEIRQK